MTASALVSFTVKVAIPPALVVPLAGEIVECPVPCARVTVFPLTGLLLASSRATVIVDVEVPFAVTVVGLAVSLDLPALGVPGVTVIVKFCVAFGRTPLLAVNVRGYVPAAVAVPLRTPVLVLNATPVGSDPLSLSVGVGVPVSVTVNDPAEPATKVVLLALVMVGAWFKSNAAVPVNVLFPVAEAEHVPVPEQPPLQSMKVEPAAACAVSMMPLKLPE